MWKFIEIYWLDVLLNWARKKKFFAIFLVPWWFLRSMGAAAQNWLILQKFHSNQNCRVSKSKIIMWHWFLVLKATKAAKWPRTLPMVLTVLFVHASWWMTERINDIFTIQKCCSVLKELSKEWWFFCLMRFLKRVSNHATFYFCFE